MRKVLLCLFLVIFPISTVFSAERILLDQSGGGSSENSKRSDFSEIKPEAILDENRTLVQHQAIITEIQGILNDPKISDFNWLDLACGKGQIILHVDMNLSEEMRKKVNFWGYDLCKEFLDVADEKSKNTGFKSRHFLLGDLAKLDDVLPASRTFDFITLTNTVHEISPRDLPIVLFDSILRLSENGSLFIYDMENLPSPELGSVPWRNYEIKEILKEFFTTMGSTDYCPFPGQWLHKTCTAWNVQIKKGYFPKEAREMVKIKGKIIERTQNKILELLKRRLTVCNRELEKTRDHGIETEKEYNEVQALLFEFWALNNAIKKF
ncbi:MAG: class I SAM-dependent methyltransferase [Candidatus Riflebacteria bacterium]|nr:class I SAM-dependent methyltransferase [Candidatus Riflebacteria bacterium]